MPMMVIAKNDRREQMAERQPPAREHQPDQVADQAERPGADVVAAVIFGARHGRLAERQQRIDGDIERRPRPGQADDGDRHDDAAISQPAAIHRPPKTIQAMFSNSEITDTAVSAHPAGRRSRKGM